MTTVTRHCIIYILLLEELYTLSCVQVPTACYPGTHVEISNHNQFKDVNNIVLQNLFTQESGV